MTRMITILCFLAPFFVCLKLPKGSFTFQTGFVSLAVIVMELIITFL